MIKTISRFLLAAIMVGAGAMHFANTDFFVKIVPPYLPFHHEIDYLSGVCEITLGVPLLMPQCTSLAAWGIMALLIAVFPANMYVYQHQEIVPASPIVHLLRLPLQGLLVLWAYWHTKPVESRIG
ncbi:MAG: putative rane protein [Planctomycetaceae bacterium]|nr:putative rane protein [Planctomycetaceae bacterium]